MSAWHYAWRGWISAGLFLVLAGVRALSDAALRPGWLALLVLAAAYRLWAARHIGPHSNGAHFEAPVLSEGGPYAFGRHPLYLSNIAAAAALVGFANCGWISLPLLVGVVLHYGILAIAEEKFLTSKFGFANSDYTTQWLGDSGNAMEDNETAKWRDAWIRQRKNFFMTTCGSIIIGLLDFI